MNSAGFVGRLTPGFFAHTLGIPNMVAASAGCGSVVILGMIGLRTVASVVVLGILYGYCAGVCACPGSNLVSRPSSHASLPQSSR